MRMREEKEEQDEKEMQDASSHPKGRTSTEAEQVTQ